ncbi:hypothetical protein [Streptomyces goshikiensis]|uniref:hypothetical protein n=1 Tax=Streptomyces goshikiensis TaxID=1942 RepID=UPI00367CFC94
MSTQTRLAEIVADYQRNVEPILLREGSATPAAVQAVLGLRSRWPEPAIRAALDTLTAAKATRSKEYGGLAAKAIAALSR